MLDSKEFEAIIIFPSASSWNEPKFNSWRSFRQGKTWEKESASLRESRGDYQSLFVSPVRGRKTGIMIPILFIYVRGGGNLTYFWMNESARTIELKFWHVGKFRFFVKMVGESSFIVNHHGRDILTAAVNVLARSCRRAPYGLPSCLFGFILGCHVCDVEILSRF